MKSRRKFLKELGSSAALMAVSPLLKGTEPKSHTVLRRGPRISVGDKIRVAGIGMGIMGFGDMKAALQVPGVEIAGVADLYEGHLTRSKEVFGKDIFATRDYRELLQRKDIDAVIVATSDNWHDVISKDAMLSGKAVYCEKPMVHHIDQGHDVIKTQQKTNAVFQVGSQRVSSIGFEKARTLFQAGAIGHLNFVEAKFSRHSALGAWQYSIPPDASANTVDFDKFLKDSPKVAYDPLRFFRWRNYKEYGTGVPGDLYVHLISGLHFITGAKGPSRIYSSGNLSQWKDGRNVPDITVSIFDYAETVSHPAFQMVVWVNFADGSGESSYTKLVGTEGVIEMGSNDFVVRKDKLPDAPGYGGWDSFDTFPEAIQKDFTAAYTTKYGKSLKEVKIGAPGYYTVPEGYDERVDHFQNFFSAMRSNKPVIENAVFGFRAAAPALLSNTSYFEKRAIKWDPEAMKVLA